MHTLILDNDTDCAGAERTLCSLGFDDIDCRSEGAGALDAIVKADPPYDLVLLDLNMPGIDGLALLRALAEARFDGGIVLLSGGSQTILSSARHIAGKQGLKILGTLAKPVAADRLRDIIRRAQAERPKEKTEFTPAHPAGQSGLVPLLHYQPQIDIRDESVVGAEALLRCRAPDGTLYGPEALLAGQEAVAPRVELAVSMFDVLCADMKALESRTGWDKNVSFNIDARVLERGDLLPRIKAAVKRHGIEPGRITIELTEARLPRDATRLLEVIARLGMAGFEMSLDDFGTGASNFELLREGAFNEVKFDKSILQAAARGDDVSRRFLQIVVDIAQTLDIRVVAEGIESERDIACMKELGITIAQGYRFSRPSDLDGFARMLAADGRTIRPEA
ncbi:EAL domain-containing response regulator [Oricola thermophila]|uniref:EAL domain-containing response regulator n=1 Tax=Oricola thermophila TaxID=2742145 RepID=A0A6N1V985_9HYPH|nr:EAL domain-containing response regulator [Oricola thermophila]QKV17561.1 EAL domain-containing response regulator [Oricola thermophila]